MTRQRQTAARPAIPLATINQMLASAFGLVALDPDHPPDGQTGQREAATALLLELCPRDAVQDTQAVRMVAGHYATMDCLRRAGLPTWRPPPPPHAFAAPAAPLPLWAFQAHLLGTAGIDAMLPGPASARQAPARGVTAAPHAQ